MATKATISPGYRWRLGMIAMICLAWACWSLYDGLIRYPRQHEMFTTFHELRDEGSEDLMERWRAIAAEKGWPPQQPTTDRTRWDIMTQYVMALIAGPIGLLFAWSFLSSGGRWIESNDAGLSTSWGQRVAFDQIKTLNKERWDSKGIAVVQYEEAGRSRRLVLDDWKYRREPTGTLVREVETRLQPDQIVGGKPEPPQVIDPPVT